jgi:hypothetical protein
MSSVFLPDFEIFYPAQINVNIKETGRIGYIFSCYDYHRDILPLYLTALSLTEQIHVIISQITVRTPLFPPPYYESLRGCAKNLLYILKKNDGCVKDDWDYRLNRAIAYARETDNIIQTAVSNGDIPSKHGAKIRADCQAFIESANNLLIRQAAAKNTVLSKCLRFISRIMKL